MTRQNVTDGPREILTKKCPTCEGDGIVVSEATAAMEIERRLRTLAAGSRSQAFQVEVAPRTAALLIGAGAGRLTEIEAVTKKRFFLVGKTGAHSDHLAVLAEGKLEDLRPEAPVEEGKEVEVKLVELGLHDAHAAVGKLDGIDVVVGGAAKLVGKKAKVRIERVLDGTAYATLLAGGDQMPDPITFESEAEKPTRAPSRTKKTADADETSDDATADELDDEVLAVDATEDDEPEDEVGVADADAAGGDTSGEDETSVAADGTVKPKTRRGSRGGRNRKKKPAVAGATAAGEDEADSDSAAAAEDGDSPAARRAPRIHMPTADLGDAPKETRSRSRAKPAAPAAIALNGDTADADAVEAQAADPDAQVVEIDPETGEPKVKRKTRRGSRGGRNRKKKPAEAGASENGAEDDPEVEAELVPDAEPDVEAAEDVVAAPAEEARVEPVAASEAPDNGGTDDYVPMSEWLDEIESGDRR